MTAPPPAPPPLSELPAGTQLVAGLGHAEVLPDLDLETYSEAGYVWSPDYRTPSGAARPSWQRMDGAPSTPQGAGLFYVGAEAYARHPSTEVLTLSYNLKDGRGVRRWSPGQPPPADLVAHLAAGGRVESHNAGFERKLWNHVLAKRHGWPTIDVSQQSCSMAKARAHGLPGALGNLQRVLGGEQKDTEGKRLLDKFSKPRNPTKGDPRLRVTLADDPADAELLRSYCDQDIVAEADASARIPDLSAEEREWWEVDQRVNDLGVAVDLPAIGAAIGIMEEALRRGDAELAQLTGGAVTRASEGAKLLAWLSEACGVTVHNLEADTIDAQLAVLRALATPTPGERMALRALEVRASCASASVKKLYQMRNCATDEGRLHDLFNYHAARTGRDTANGAQPQNLPNSGPDVVRCECGRHHRPGRATCPWCGRVANTQAGEWSAEAADDAIAVILCANIDLLADMMGDPLAVISACLRGMFVAGPGHRFVSSDYSAIEAVVLAMLAGEQWRIDLFREGGKIYEASGARITGVAYEEMLAHKARTGSHHPARKKGKVAELALGYGGWIGALVAFGAGEWMTEPEMKELIQTWRAANPAIVEFWGGQYRGLPWEEPRRVEYFGLEGAAVQAVMHPGQSFPVGQSGVSYIVHGGVLYCTLPSGRRLAYHAPRLRANERDKWGQSYALSFEGWNSNPKKGAMGWVRMDLYGGLLCENCIAEGTEVLTDSGWKRIEDVGTSDRVHDGLEFVSHAGLLYKGRQPCTAVDGVRMTPDHEVLTDDGWKAASQNPRPYRPDLRGADCGLAGAHGRPQTVLEDAVPVRPGGGAGARRYAEAPDGELRVHDQAAAAACPANARHEPASGVLRLEVNGRQVHAPDASSVAELRRPGDHGVRRVAGILRGVLARHGADLLARLGVGPQGQRGGVYGGQLPLGAEAGAGEQSTREHQDPDAGWRDDRGPSLAAVRRRTDDHLVPAGERLADQQAAYPAAPREPRVFDIVNAGPRQRFVVRGDSGPFIVHNCVQATARDVLRDAAVRLWKAGYPIVLRVHDELVAEVPDGFGSLDEFERIMGDHEPWAAGWPIRAAGGWEGPRFRK